MINETILQVESRIIIIKLADERMVKLLLSFRLIHCTIKTKDLPIFVLNVRTSSENARLHLELVAFVLCGIFPSNPIKHLGLI